MAHAIELTGDGRVSITPSSPCCSSSFTLKFRGQTESKEQDHIDVIADLACPVCGRLYSIDINVEPLMKDIKLELSIVVEDKDA